MKKIFILLILILISGCITGEVVKYPEIYFCPRDDCKSAVVYNLNKAEHSIYFLSYSFTDGDIADLLIKKSKEIDVKGVFEKRGITSKYSQFKKLKENGIKVKFDKNKNLMHHKIFIIDNETVITGSINPTKNGFFANNENILIIHDKKVAEEYLEEFDRIYGK